MTNTSFVQPAAQHQPAQGVDPFADLINALQQSSLPAADVGYEQMVLPARAASRHFPDMNHAGVERITVADRTVYTVENLGQKLHRLAAWTVGPSAA